jgi:hypothetical protein
MWHEHTTNQTRTTFGARGWLALFATIFASMLLSNTAGAQMGPVDVYGFLEYRYRLFKPEGLTSLQSQGASLQTNVSTFLWRPWILGMSGSLSLSKRTADARLGQERTTLVRGGLRLNFLARSRFPLVIFYEDLDGNVESDVNNRIARTRDYGFLQQYSSDRYGAYSLELRRGFTDLLFSDGTSIPTRNDNEKWQLRGRKSFGRNGLMLTSQKRNIRRQFPDQRTDSLRHTLRHTFRLGSAFDLRNTYFFSDEQLNSEQIQTGRRYQQLTSVSTWRPNTEKRLLVSGRALLQSSDSTALMGDINQSVVSLSVTANYEYTPRITMTGGVGVLSSRMDSAASSDSSFQRIGVNYNSESYELWGGTYTYSGQAGLGNSALSAAAQDFNVRSQSLNLGHSFARPLETRSGSRREIRFSQRATTVHDTAARNLSTLQHSAHLTQSSQRGRQTRYFRFSILDQRTFGDEQRVYQLVNAQFSLQHQVNRDSAWNGNASIQYGRRQQDKPVESADESSSINYSVNFSYRRSNIFDISFLNYSSDFRFLSEDFSSRDPFDSEFDTERERFNSSWRNRLDYRVGLLQLRADVDLREINGEWRASVSLYARRFYGVR